MKRVSDWENKLLTYLEDPKPFKWGERDCCFFANDAVLAITGVDVMKRFRNEYSSEEDGIRLMPFGLDVAVSWEMKQNNFQEIHPNFAQRGDIVLTDTQLGEAIGVVGFDGKIHGQAENGVLISPISRGIKAWRIG